ncbi:MAG: CHAT domain-containing protein [Thainema sp.]
MKHRLRFLFYSLLALLTASWIVLAKPGLTDQPAAERAQSVAGSTIDLVVPQVIGQQLDQQLDQSIDQLQLSQASQLEQEARSAYRNGQYAAAVRAFQTAAEAYAAAGDRVQQAAMLSNLSLAYQQLGEWTTAEEAITTAISLLQPDTVSEPIARSPQQWSALAQSQSIQAQLQFAQGQAEAAEATWQQAEVAYQAASDLPGMLTSQINRAQALQAIGFYPDALKLLTSVVEGLQDQPDSALKVMALQNLGAAQIINGDLETAEHTLQQSLELAQQLGLADAESAAYLSLGDLQLQRQQAVDGNVPLTSAQVAYQQAAIAAQSPLAQVDAQLKHLNSLIQLQRWQEAQLLWPDLQNQLEQLPPSRRTIYANISFVTRLQDLRNGLATVAQAALQPELAEDSADGSTSDEFSDEFDIELSDEFDDEPDRVAPVTLEDRALLAELLAQLPTRLELAQQLLQVRQQAHQLGDQRAEAYIVGQLAHLYEESGQWAEAEDLTRQALALSQSGNAPDVVYQWQWQLGRLRKAQNDRAGAIAAYSESVDTLQSLRSDLAAASREFQFSFRKDVEPIYRELVDLLLSGDDNPENLAKAREVIESLQLAELDNYFREACLDANPVQVDEIDQQAAVVYTVVLPERLEVLVRLPNEEWIHHSEPVAQTTLTATVNQLVEHLSDPFNISSTSFSQPEQDGSSDDAVGFEIRPVGDPQAFMRDAQQLYNWLIQPIAADLAAAQPQTLVFVLDDQLRKVPMSVLHDGNQYLIEQYAIALTPGLQLLEAAPLAQREVRAIVAGLSEERKGVAVGRDVIDFPQLDAVKAEVETIRSLVSSEVLLNEEFEAERLERTVSRLPFPVVHLATHGVFSSDLENTFVLTWDGKLNANQLSALLQSSELIRDGAVELLVLSACETATGDDRAALGLAGIAVRSGARSTLATLWQVNDTGTAQFMQKVYQSLSDTTLTKAEIVRQAQIELINSDSYLNHPFIWAPFVLIGNWI